MPSVAKCDEQDTKIIQINWDGENWRIVLLNRYKLELVFDPAFNWKSTLSSAAPNEQKIKMVPILPNPVK